MRSQGIKGPAYKFLHGNTKEISEMRQESTSTPMDLSSHHIYPRILPEIYSWTKLYGKNFVCWRGPQALLVVSEPEMIKEALSNKNGAYPKPKIEGLAKKLITGGIVAARGEEWYKLRKIANHTFNGESLKGMVAAMIASVEEMRERWRTQEGKEIEVYEEFKILTSEIIARTAFGSSYLEGKSLFNMLSKLLEIIFRNYLKIRFPGAGKLFKSADDIESDKLGDVIRETVVAIIEKREQKVMTGEAESFGSDFLGSLIRASHEADKSMKISIEDMIDECKTFFIAAEETTSAFLAWVTYLLAIHLEWQEEARNEVLELFGQEIPNSEGIARLKIMSMIINETLRLYPPGASLTRKVESKTRLGNIIVPANTELFIPVLALHHDPEIWGQDAHLFKPERFAEGVAKATNDNPMAFLPFGFGPRICAGVNFAGTESKIALSMILQRYKFTLSPTYVHSPFQTAHVRPQHGVQIVLQKL